MAAKAPCEICGDLTGSKYGVCIRTPECSREYGLRYRAADHSDLRCDPCEVCGQPTVSKLGVCQGTPECSAEAGRRWYQKAGKAHAAARVLTPEQKAADVRRHRDYNRRWRAANPEKKREENRGYQARTLPVCEVCGGPTFSHSGICTKTPGCLEARGLRRRAAKPPGPQKPSLPPCAVCGMPTRSALGVCQRSQPCRDEYARRIPDRRPACLGCGKPTGAESGRCPPCQSRYRRNQGGPWKAQRPPWWNRRTARHRKVAQLAAIQHGLCAWCRDPLGDDPGVIEIDHKIPQVILWRALGYVIHDDWNLQVLHPPCNLDKSDGATAEAVALADEHGLDLGAWGRWLRTDRQQELFAAS